ncbi:glycoside hydrolase family 5 protein [Zalerion maritima]|uniref:glucan 1,3-beta-glucosidase n=1 Tax=Zalerion maritima TaxID=339359 RepID=A0AAD5RXT1_9PEZI|nr:glycoside hydrolase family 5 protein [Zalerion maritima]
MAPPEEQRRRRRRESSARREREDGGDRERDRDRSNRRSRPPSSRPLSRYVDESTPEGTPRSHRRRSRSQSQSRGGGATLSTEALAALNSANARTRRHSTSQPSREEPTRERTRQRAASRDDAGAAAPRTNRQSRRVETERGREREKKRSGGYAHEDPYRDGREYRDSRDLRNSRDLRGYGRDTAYDPGAYVNARAAAVETREERRARRKAEKKAAAAAAAAEAEAEAAVPLASERHDSEQERWQGKSKRKRRKRRLVSGAVMEEGAARGVGGSRPESEEYMLNEKEGYTRASDKAPSGKRRLNKKRIMIFGGVVLVLIIIAIAVGVVVAKKSSSSSDDDADSLDSITEDNIPAAAQGTYLDPFTWYDTTDFNVTYTNETYGDLPIMGLYADWDDSTQANDNVPALDEDWGSYGDTPARGVNLGGWLNLEPFITPSLFNYDEGLGIIDEWTLCTHLGEDEALSTLEKHYATFVTEATFSAIADAGLDHVRISYAYWAVQTYDDDPYVFRTSWRYLLRGIEWARKYGLRVNLDIHGLPGSQNGWNHSGRQGPIGWLNGTDGDLNRQRSLDVHDRLSKFFAQDRYKNIITFYGLANEPKMTALKASDVVAWTEEAYALVKGNGVDAIQVFGDGFMGLDNWQGMMTGYDNLALDVHQYLIFNTNQIVFTHEEKIKYACSGWSQQTEESMNTATGFGPTVFAEWSQADTDCTTHLNNVGQGNRWEGTYDTGDDLTSILTPRCPEEDDSCTCSDANADTSRWSDEYKEFLLLFAEAQMYSFEKGWGWWYWTWETESAPQWSYKAGLDAGVLPQKAYDRSFYCDQSDIPDFSGLPEYY